MPKKKRLTAEEEGGLLTADSEVEALDGETEDLLPEGKLVCALTGQQRLATAQEETTQSFIEQLHRENGVALEDMGRDARVRCTSFDEKKGKERTRTRSVSLVVYETGTDHQRENIIRVALVSSRSCQPSGE
jgi:type I restriction enzyme M protein